MPWKEVSTMSLRSEFVMLVSQPGVNKRALCQRYGISPKTGYKWLHRYAAEGRAGLMDRSRRPAKSPTRTRTDIEAQVLELRRAHPAWGGRKLARRLQNMGVAEVPAPSTITAIVKRHGLLALGAEAQPSYRRFEHPYPNAFWQMDFKGHFALTQGRCHPLTVLDDHSRFNLQLGACANERGATVRDRLTRTFRLYGLPERIGVDNGAPWGQDFAHTLTPLTVWLLHIGVSVSHSRPYHPQTLGKDERFHRSLKAEVIKGHTFGDLADCQSRFDHWRDCYNLERPHEALDMATPASRYQPSPRPFPETLPKIEYGAHDIVRKVQAQGELFYCGRTFRIAHALRGYPVALRPTEVDGVLAVYFCHHKVAEIDQQHPYR